ncbi:MAG: ribokinase [Opitutaceae bacterium]|nr:ribokinase [Opitutaceae bacterium]
MPKKSNSIVVVGSSNTDMILRVPRIPGPGETLLGGEFAMAAGGKGANQAVAAARAGGQVTFVGAFGEDSLGEQALAGLRREGIDVSHVRRVKNKASGVALIFVSNEGENCIGVAGGANEALLPADVVRVRDVFTPGAWVVMQLETPLRTITRVAALAKKAGCKVILNPAPAATLPGKLLTNIDLLTPNEHEASVMTGHKVVDQKSAKLAAEALHQRGVAGVIITLGARGAYVSVGEMRTLAPGFKVKPVDTTAAGDVFNGALAVRLSEGAALDDAIRFAHAAAAISVTRRGAQPSIPNRREITRFL